MTSRMRFLRCASAAALALALVGPATARADTTTRITPGGSKGKITGEQVSDTFKFFYDGRSIKCATLAWEESFIGSTGTKTLPFDPVFTGCKTVPGELSVTFKMNECSFLVEGVPTNGSGTYLATTELACPITQKLEVVVYSKATHLPENEVCNYTIVPQVALGNVVLENRLVGSEYDDVWLKAEGVSFETGVDGPALICGANGKEAQIFGSTTMRAFAAEGEQTKLTARHET